MSILAGAVDWSRSGRARADAEAMLAFESWRPDGMVVRSTPRATLGVGRLITTPRHARPVPDSQSPNIIAVVDGRLDELDALRAALGAGDDASDVDLVIAGYRRWGTDVVSKLKGEFVLLIWDEGASRLVAARDPFGVRPLYYARVADRMLAASDPEQILATGSVAPVPDDHSVVTYLLWASPAAERSFFRDMRRLPAGHLLVADAESVRIEDYRRFDVAVLERADARECFTEFERRFMSAVGRRLDSTRPVLIHLSGGLDSTSIACAANRICAQDESLCQGVVAVSALSPGIKANDEERYLRAVEAEIRIPVESWDVTAADPHELDDVFTWAPGGRVPWAGGNAGDVLIAQGHGARVILNGTGGDQLGASYGSDRDAVVQGRWLDAARFILKAPRADARSSLRAVLRLVKSFGPGWARDFHDRIRAAAEHKPTWLVDRAWKQWRSKPSSPAVPPGLRTHLQRQRWEDLNSGSHISGLEWIQQCAIRNGIELRFPFLDWDLVMFTLSIPSRHWPPPWPRERLHRAALAGLIPSAVQKRRSKAIASGALANRVKRQLPTIRRMFESGPWLVERYVSRAGAHEVLMAFEGSANPPFPTTWRVWGIAAVEAWLRKLSGYTPSPKREARAHGRTTSLDCGGNQ